MRSSKVMVGVLALLLVAGACKGEPTKPPEPTDTPDCGDGDNPVSLAEWSVTAQASTGRGENRFCISNDGGTVHQLAIYRGGSLSGDTIDGGTLLAQTNNIRAGEATTLQESLEPGDYWLVCPIPGHTAAGMHAQLAVGS